MIVLVVLEIDYWCRGMLAAVLITVASASDDSLVLAAASSTVGVSHVVLIWDRLFPVDGST
jgi:hypothetical protein